MFEPGRVGLLAEVLLNDTRYLFKIGLYTPEAATPKVAVSVIALSFHRLVFNLRLLGSNIAGIQSKKEDGLDISSPPAGG